MEGGHIKNRVWMKFDNIKAPEELMGKELWIGSVSTKSPSINDLKDDLSFFDNMSIDSHTTTKFRDYMWLFGVNLRKGGGVQFFGRIGELLNVTGKCIQYGGILHYPVQGQQLCGRLFYFYVSDPHYPCLFPHIHPSILIPIHMDQV